jgi:hypothetical protein
LNGIRDAGLKNALVAYINSLGKLPEGAAGTG